MSTKSVSKEEIHRGTTISLDDLLNAAGRGDLTAPASTRKQRRRARMAGSTNMALLAGLLGVSGEALMASDDTAAATFGSTICTGGPSSTAGLGDATIQASSSAVVASAASAAQTDLFDQPAMTTQPAAATSLVGSVRSGLVRSGSSEDFLPTLDFAQAANAFDASFDIAAQSAANVVRNPIVVMRAAAFNENGLFFDLEALTTVLEEFFEARISFITDAIDRTTSRADFELSIGGRPGQDGVQELRLVGDMDGEPEVFVSTPAQPQTVRMVSAPQQASAPSAQQEHAQHANADMHEPDAPHSANTSHANHDQEDADAHSNNHEEANAGNDDGEHAGHASGADSGGHYHPDDPAKANEHGAILDLVAVADATHVAIADGSWFDPAVWANGDVPGAGARVLIPEGRTIAYDGQSNESIFSVRVDGQVDFATDQDTYLKVDTFVVTPAGRLTIGTESNPVDADVQAVISIANNGDINTAWDPLLLSRGVISHGSVEIHGAEKENFLKVASDPMRGDSSITLDPGGQSVESLGWRVGDTIVLTGTRLTPHDAAPSNAELDRGETEDEERVITGISGNTIYFDEPLDYDHDTPRDDLAAYVANQTRNIRFESEDGADTPVHQRGHVMFMNSDDIDVRYAEFTDLGRTDKSRRSFDVGALDSVDADSNIQGRYSLHIHRAGIEDADNPAMIIGNAVSGVVGWGIVHHDSNAIISSNSVYDIVGAGIVAEAGNETGRWADNIVIKTIGTGGLFKDGEDTNAFDLGRQGVGFWFQSRLVEAVDNVVAGAPGGFGFVYYSRGVDPHELRVQADQTSFGEAFRASHGVKASQVPITVFQDNEAFAVDTGFLSLKADSNTRHDVRSIIGNFDGWEVRVGINLDYVNHYTFEDIRLIGPSDANAIQGGAVGVYLGGNIFDQTFNKVEIDGFEQGFFAHRNFTLDPSDTVDTDLTFIDVSITGAIDDYVNPGPSDTFLTSSDLTPRAVTYESGLPDVDGDGIREWTSGVVVLDGVKTDSIGQDTTSKAYDRFYIDNFDLHDTIVQNGYWLTESGDHVTILEEYVADRATGDLIKTSIFVEFDPGLFKIQEYNYNGVLDLNNSAPVANADSATVSAGGSVTIDVLANDVDAEGETLIVDGFYSTRGRVLQNDDGTLTYYADSHKGGVDTFKYFVHDESGNISVGEVTVTVEI